MPHGRFNAHARHTEADNGGGMMHASHDDIALTGFTDRYPTTFRNTPSTRNPSTLATKPAQSPPVFSSTVPPPTVTRCCPWQLSPAGARCYADMCTALLPQLHPVGVSAAHHQVASQPRRRHVLSVGAFASKIITQSATHVQAVLTSRWRSRLMHPPDPQQTDGPPQRTFGMSR